MLKNIFTIFFFVILLFFLNGCERDSSVNPLTPVTKGFLILYEGGFTPGSGDFSFVNTNNDSIYNNVYSNSNSGAMLGLLPDCILLHPQFIYITVQGSYGGPGKMYRLDYNTYKVNDTSVNFGVNPYDFVLANGNFYVTNTAGSTVTKLSASMEIVNPGIEVGANPSKILDAFHSVYVAKQSYTTEYSLAIIDFFNDVVTKAYFPAPPVSIARNQGLIYVSTYFNKKLYALDTTQTNKLIDSVSMNIPEAAIGEIVSGDYRTLYVVGVADTSFQSNIGKTLYKVDLITKQIDANFTINLIPPGDIYGLAYDDVNQIIYIADSRGGSTNGEVYTYSTSGTLLKSYHIGGKFPRKFGFRYDNH